MFAQPGPPYLPASFVERLSRTIGFLPLMIMGARIFGIPSVMPHQARPIACFPAIYCGSLTWHHLWADQSEHPHPCSSLTQPLF